MLKLEAVCASYGAIQALDRGLALLRHGLEMVGAGDPDPFGEALAHRCWSLASVAWIG